MVTGHALVADVAKRVEVSASEFKAKRLPILDEFRTNGNSPPLDEKTNLKGTWAGKLTVEGDIREVDTVCDWESNF